MKKIQSSQTSLKKSYSKSFTEGIATLVGEIELALQWNRPTILLAVNAAAAGRVEAQQFLEKQIIKRGWKAVHIQAEGEHPDVIQTMLKLQGADKTIFFVSGIRKANEASAGRVYSALNFSREMLVENYIRVVFWLDEMEAESLPRLAPDFWAFRHRVIDFAAKRGRVKHPLPAGLFLWSEHIPWMNVEAQKVKFAYYENLLKQIPADESAATSRLEIILHLVEHGWILNELNLFKTYLNKGFALLEKYPLPAYHAWMLNARAIALYEQGHKHDADTDFTQALSEDPANSTLMMNAAIAAHGLGRHKNTLLLAKRALKNQPRNTRLQQAMGYLFFFMGKIEAAITAMTTAQEIVSNDADSLYALAIFRYQNNQLVECAEALSKASTISPPQNIIASAYIDMLNGRADKALEGLRQSVISGEVSNCQILRDPNLHILLDQRDFVLFNGKTT